MMMTMTNRDVVKVQREKLQACMTCPLCRELYQEATTISECLHTFCKKCIHKAIIDDECDKCPVCNADLGVAPLEKLRVDNSLQDLRLKLFPSGTKKVKAPASYVGAEKDLLSERRKGKAVDAVAPSVPSLGKQKERSLSSLGTSRPTGTTRSATRRKKYSTRKSSTHEELAPKAEDFLERIKSTRQNTIEESSKKDEENSCIKNYEPQSDEWKPFSQLVEAASSTKPVLCESFNLNIIPEEEESTEEHETDSEYTPSPSRSVPSGKGKRGHRRKVVDEPQQPVIPAQEVASDSNHNCETRFKPIWFALIASSHQEGYPPLPQIPSCYLRVKDGNVPISTIKMYLMRKLNLSSESEVEIFLWGKPILPTLLLQELVDLWLKHIPASQRIQSSVGSSAKDYVMALTYSRRNGRIMYCNGI